MLLDPNSLIKSTRAQGDAKMAEVARWVLLPITATVLALIFVPAVGCVVVEQYLLNH